MILNMFFNMDGKGKCHAFFLSCQRGFNTIRATLGLRNAVRMNAYLQDHRIHRERIQLILLSGDSLVCRLLEFSFMEEVILRCLILLPCYCIIPWFSLSLSVNVSLYGICFSFSLRASGRALICPSPRPLTIPYPFPDARHQMDSYRVM